MNLGLVSDPISMSSVFISQIYQGKVAKYFSFWSFCEMFLRQYNKIAMYKHNYELLRQRTVKNTQFTPKIHAKKAINLTNRKPLAGQQSAHRPTRSPKQRLLALSEHGTFGISQQSVRSSTIYKMLEQQMRILSQKHESQMTKLRQVKQQREKQLKNMVKDDYNTKIQIWQLKNEVMELKESIREQKQETQRLNSEIIVERDSEPQQVQS